VAQVNEHGRWIAAPEGVKPQRWRARTKYRDDDGKLRDVERFGPTKGKAETRLKSALTSRTTPTKGTGALRAEMSLSDAGDVWLELMERPESGLSARTQVHYRDIFTRLVSGGSVAGHSLREVNRVPVLRAYLQGVADAHGSGSARSTRTVVSGILSLAVEDGVLDSNALRDVRHVKAKTPRGTKRDTTRALTREERDHLIKVADANELATHLDVADIVAYMAGVGCRISEALGQQWADIDLEASEVRIRGTKSTTSDRTLTLAPWLVERLTARAEHMGTEGLLFPSPGLSDLTIQRDRRNVARIFRKVLDEAGFPWATPHTLRRTVASLIDGSGLSVAEAADYLGHKDPSMTARVYLGRKSTSARAAAVL
jgi:integrase